MSDELRTRAGSEDLFARLDELGIAYRTKEHAPVPTVEAAREVWADVEGAHCKNLFLKDAKGRLWLLVAPIDLPLDLKGLRHRIGAARLSFGNGELLREVLGVEPGSVTPFAVINDSEHRVTVVLDKGMMAQALLNFHPLRNTATTTIAASDLTRFLRACGTAYQVVDLDLSSPQ